MRELSVVLGAALALSACDGEDPADAGAVGSGDVSVIVEAEDTITDGLDPGMTGEAIQDGWAVRFNEYVVAIGDVDAHLTRDESVFAEASTIYGVDLTAVPESGLPLWSLDDLESGRWELNYAIVGAADGAMPHASVATTTFDEMVAGDLTYLIAGTLTQTGGQSCPPASLATPGGATPNGMTNADGDDCYDNDSVTFRLGLQAETAFGPCEVDEMPGFAVTAGSPTTVALTIHGDHLFFNGFPEGGEGSVMRLAQWLADCDLDLDGSVTRAELEAIAPSDLAAIDGRFQLGGSPITPLANMWDYLRAQVKTQGHFQGEGECPVDGVGHMH